MFFTQKYYTYSCDSFDRNCINVELVDKMIRELKRGKAAGLDGLMADWLNTWFLVIPMSVFC